MLNRIQSIQIAGVFFQNLTEFTYKQCLIIQQMFMNFNSITIYGLELLQQLQLLCLWWNSTQNQKIESRHSLLTLLKGLSKFIQPYRSVISVLDLLIITFVLNIALQSYFLFDYFIYKFQAQKRGKQEKFTKYFESKSECLKSVSQIVYIYINCFNISLLIPFLELNYLAFIIELKRDQISAYAFISIYNIVSCLAISLSLIILMNESLTIKLRNFQNFRNTFTVYIQYLLTLLMIFLNDINIVSDNQIVCTISLCVYNCITIKNSLNQQKIGRHNNFLLLINCFSFVLCLINTIFQSQQLADSIFLLLFPPIAGTLIFQLNRNYADSLIFKSNSHPNHLQHKLGLILSQKDQQNQKFNSVLVFDRQVYLWQNRHIISKQLGFDEKLYFKFVCDCYKRLLGTDRKDTNRFIYKLHSISVISELGYNTSALIYAGNILQENSTIHSSEKQEKLISHDSSKTKNPDHDQTYQLKNKQLTFIQRIKLQVLQEIISNKITEGFIKNEDSNDETVTEVVKIYLATETLKKKNIQEILSIIQMKKKFLIDIQSILNKNLKILFNRAKEICQRMQNFETTLESAYSNFPSQQLQSIYSFYAAEIQGNYFKANQISILSQIKDEGSQLFKATKMQMNLFSSQTNYLLCELESDLNITILEKSNYCHQFFEYNQSQFAYINSVNSLLPYGFVDIHKQLVQKFLQKGNSKYFRQSNYNIGLMKSKLLKQFEFFFEINNMSTTNLQMTAFIKEHSSSDDCLILINTDQRIAGVTRNLFKLVQYRSQIVNQLNLIQFLYQQKVTSLLPDLYKNSEIDDTLADYYDEEAGNYCVRFQFLKESYVLMQLQESNMFFDWENSYNLDTYTASIEITKYEALNQFYWKVNVSNIKLSTMTHTQGTYLSVVKSLKMNNQNHNFMKISNEGRFNIPPDIDERQLNSKQSISNQQEKQQSFGNKMIQILKQQRAVTSQIPVIIINDQVLFEENQNVYFPSEIGQRILSPKESCKGLMNTSQIQNQKQQQFFKSQQKESSIDISIEQENMVKSKKSEKLFNLEDDDNHVRKAIESQFNGKKNSHQILDQASISSSIGGFKRSKYFHKYLLYSQYQETKLFPLNFVCMMIFYSLALLISFIYCLLIINNSVADLNRFLIEIDMLSLKGAILGPFWKYNGILFQIANYIQNIYVFGDDPILLNQQMEFDTYQRSVTYDQFKFSFQEQMNNPFVQQFFIGQSINVSFQLGFDQLEFRTISFRESLQLLVEAGFVYKQGLYDFWVTNHPHMTYFGSNLFTFTNRLQQLTDDIQQYTFIRTYQVADKWLSLFIPFLIIMLIILMITFLAYRRYLFNYDYSLSFFQLMTKQQIQHEILRLKAIGDIINEDVTVILNYQFDAVLKDKYIQTQTNKETQKLNKQVVFKSRNKLRKLSIIPSFAIYFLQAVLFMIFALIIQLLVSNFLVEYRQSVKYYRRLTDAAIAVSGVYSYKELLYYQHNDSNTFFYLQKEQLNEIEKQYLNYMQDIINFQQKLVVLDTSNSLISSSFINHLNQIKKSDICQQLPVEEQVVAKIHCENIYGGVMLKGLASTLVQIVNSLQTEFSITKFVYRDKYPNQEIEIGVITTEVLQQLLDYFKDSLVTTTGNLISQFQTLSICYIVYVVLQLIILYRFVLNYFIAEFKTIRRFIQILPQQMLFADNTFERSLRTFINQSQLI